ncbi:hypothetical protein AA103196_1397 [Ameyamaea chiangmaiensis NBRC 103196]|uniref:Cell division protein ZapA n=1 Tax=Ameyamaea chiangmaiensis TaxID=442969 RepID=A0A850PCP9_9PROT|nr:cell division protein ZapA [Ameyamaea chiangmaiensis]MBS4075219.1 cell division protein ZapA [Ameyamaea chiangmaiensis]NVN41758.1 cell division protein ZapA [Ameyamaea chiangmaiensis]GBQ66441.1 hypothetical protein AA103196_1397 [Ameyamaea chiangmaiensis NBRC 103196]
MGQVNLRINGYVYTIGCADGEEGHLQAMGRVVESRIDALRSSGARTGEARTLLLAALQLADEVHDLSANRLPSSAAEELAGARAARLENQQRREQLALLVERAEGIAAALEQD